jgi:hypothetical protein
LGKYPNIVEYVPRLASGGACLLNHYPTSLCYTNGTDEMVQHCGPFGTDCCTNAQASKLLCPRDAPSRS